MGVICKEKESISNSPAPQMNQFRKLKLIESESISQIDLIL